MSLQTYGQLKEALLKEAGVKDHFGFLQLSDRHTRLWDALNAEEFGRGNSSDYVKDGTPSLVDMELLTQDEFNDWVTRLKAIRL